VSGDFTPVSADCTPIKAAAKLIFLTCDIMPKVKASQKINIMPYPHVNCTVKLERLDPEMFTVPKLNTEILQTQKKREYWKRKNEEYRNEINSDFNLLRKWVPGTKYLTRGQLLKKTVNYIQELQKKIKELETSQTPREPQSSPSEPVKTFASTPTGASPTDHSVILKSLRNKILGTSETESESQESLLASPEEKLLASPEEKLPEFNTVEEFGQWLKMEDMNPSEDLSPEEEMELLASPECPEFDTVEDVRRWLLSPKEEMELLASPEKKLPEKKLPEFNSVEDVRRCLEL
jgi:hypothetical protein